MVTRFYINNGSASAVASGISSLWDVTAAGYVVRDAVTTKANTAIVATGYNETSATAVNMGCRPYVSARLAGQNISGTFSAVQRMLESINTADASYQIIIRVVSEDGSTTRAHLYSGHSAALNTTVGALGEEIGTISATRIFNAVSLSSYTCVDGDRLSIEIGWRAHNLTGSSRGVTLRSGDPTASGDFALTSGLTTDLCPWVEFSQTLAPLVAYQVTGSVAAVSGTTGDVTIVPGGTTYQVTGTAAVVSSTSGAVAYLQPAAGSAAVTSGTTGTVTSYLQATGTAAATSATSGAVTAYLQASGTAAATSATTGAATLLRPASGTVAVVSETTGTVAVYLHPSGSAAVVSGTTGTAASVQPVAGSAAIVSGTTGTAEIVAGSGTYQVSGTVAVVSGSTGTVAAYFLAVGTVAVTSDTSGTVGGYFGVAGVVPVVTTTTGTPAMVAPVSGQVDVVSGTSGAVRDEVEYLTPPERTVTFPAANHAATFAVRVHTADCPSGGTRTVSFPAVARSVVFPAEIRELEAV